MILIYNGFYAMLHLPHDLTQINLALPRLLPSSSKIKEPHLFCSSICSHVKILFFNFNSVSDETASSQVIVGEAVGEVVGDFVSVGDDVGASVHVPHDWAHINLALPRLLPSSSKIKEPHFFFSTICSHVKILFFNFNSVSTETVSSQTVGAGDVVGAGETVGDTVGDAVGDDVGAGEAVGEDVGSNVNLHPVHDLIQIVFAFPRLFPSSSKIKDPHLFFSTIC